LTAPRPAQPSARWRCAIGLTALVTLLLELTLTRVFDVILAPNLAYMVITSAVFAFGLAGLYATLWPLIARPNLERVLASLAVLFALATAALLPTLNWLPFQLEQVAEHPLKQATAFGAMYLVLVIPFFLSGLILTTVFSRYPRQIQRLYFWDLVGAAIGCLALVLLLPAIGPGGLLFLAAGLALVASALFAGARRWSIGAGGLTLAAIAVPFLVTPRRLDFRDHVNKRGVEAAQAQGTIEFSRWDPVSKIDVIPTGRALGRMGDSIRGNRSWHIAYDGGQQSSNFFAFDGNLIRLRSELDRGVPGTVGLNFTQRGVLASHYLQRDRGQKVLIFGSAGGQETKAAVVYGASRVDAVEMVRTVVELATTRYAKAIGDLFHRPNVHVRVGEGRSFLRASHDRYDIIQIFSNSTSSSIANGTGALSPTYFLTVEAFREYFEHLTPDGILHINHLAYPRMITTAALAWRQLGRADFRRHVVVMERVQGEDDLPTLLIRMRPWTPAEVADLRRFFAMDPLHESPRRLVESPVDPAGSFLSEDFYDGHFPARLARRMLWRATPVTDDQPFFQLLRKRIEPLEPDSATFLNPSVAALLNVQLKKGRVPLDLVHLFVVGVVSLAFAVVSIGIPLRFAPVGRRSWAGKGSSMAYFACLGAGFMTLELVLIQVFMKLIGYPVYTYSVVIFGLLVAAGIGSRLSAAVGVRADRRWTWPFLGILTSGTMLLLSQEAVFAHFLAASLPVRILVALGLIFPLGLFLGMPFPLGILALEHQPRGAVAWAWGVNGVFTQIGGLASVLLSLTFGFRAALVGGVLAYAVGFAIYAQMRRAAEVTEQVGEELSAPGVA
jgi:hypothetical protein